LKSKKVNPLKQKGLLLYVLIGAPSRTQSGPDFLTDFRGFSFVDRPVFEFGFGRLCVVCDPVQLLNVTSKDAEIRNFQDVASQ
jgi:hypothetical protein